MNGNNLVDYKNFPNYAGNNSGGEFDFNFGDFSNILSGVGSLVGAYNGLQALDLGEEQFQFGRDLALTNLNNQARLTNSQLTDRQNRRIRNAGNDGTLDNGGTILSTADYLAQFGVSNTLGGNAAPTNTNQLVPPPPVNNTPTNRNLNDISTFGRG